jgi:hypothetical protein
MSESTIEAKPASTADDWRERIAAQQRSGLSVKRFCEDQGIAEHRFYAWRKRLRGKQAVRFALVDRGSVPGEGAACLEIILATGERLRIGAGVDAATLRTVLEVLRA